MTMAVQVIWLEHVNILSVLARLRYLVDEIEAGRWSPDFGLLENILDYMANFPEVTHHPKEEASTFTAMTAFDPVASRSPDRTGVCGTRRGALSRREKVTGRALDRQIGSTEKEDRYADCRIRTEFDVNRRYCDATSNRKWSSGESRVIVLQPTAQKRA